MTEKNTKDLKKPSFVSEAPKPIKEESSFSISPKVLKIMPWCYAIIFTIIAAYYLIGENSDVLYMAQNRNLFLDTPEYFSGCMKYPGGLLVWLSTYFTQYFYNPATGACILISIWLLTFAAAKYAFDIKNVWTILILIPLVGLLCSDISVGYWIYYMKAPGHYFTTSIGLLITMVAVLINRFLPEKIKLAWIVIWAIGAFPLFGWFSWIGTIFMAVEYFVNFKDKKLKAFIIPVTGIVIALLVPTLSLGLYPNQNSLTVYFAAMPIYWASDSFTKIAELPFVIVAIVPIFFALFSNKGAKETCLKGMECVASLATVIAVFGASYVIANKVNVDDSNYHTEIRMFRAIEDMDWNEALSEMAQVKGDATREMVLFKNVALLNTGHLGDALFRYNNMGEKPHVYDSLEVHMVQTCAPLIYYNHGKTNFAYRWCIENSVEFGFKVSDLKTLARCTIISKEWDAARKYLEILKHTKFHKEWAEKYDALIANPDLITEYHEFDTVRDLYDHMGTTLDGDNGLCEMYLLNYFSNTMNKDSQKLQELTLAYALIQKDIQLFWPRFLLYAQLHKGEDMPIHYQEAAFLYGNLEPQTMNIQGMPFNKEKVIDRYASFTSMSQQLMQQQKSLNQNVDTKKIGEMMKPAFGDTFYWFYFFCRDIQSY